MTNDEWLYCIERILLGHKSEVLSDERFDHELIKKLCRTLGYNDGELD